MNRKNHWRTLMVQGKVQRKEDKKGMAMGTIHGANDCRPIVGTICDHAAGQSLSGRSWKDVSTNSDHSSARCLCIDL